MSNPIGIYLHIPFCISKCPYCDFYSLPYCEQNAQQYVGALLHALDTAPGKGREVDSIYFGCWAVRCWKFCRECIETFRCSRTAK